MSEPVVTVHANTATVEADPRFLRMLVTEAKRSGQAQLMAFGVTQSWRAFWTGEIKRFDALLAQLPTEDVKPVAKAPTPAVNPLAGLLG